MDLGIQEDNDQNPLTLAPTKEPILKDIDISPPFNLVPQVPSSSSQPPKQPVRALPSSPK